MSSKEEEIEPAEVNNAAIQAEHDVNNAVTPPNYDVAKARRCREEALKELVNTEKTYVDSIGKLVDADHEQIFPKVLHSIYNLHNRLLGELDYTYSLCHDQSNSDLLVKDQKMKRNIGSVMLEYAPLFRMYQIYMNTYERSQKALTMAKQKNRRFAKWLQVQPAGNLENLLILPIQRIPRYRLMLEVIIKQSRRAGDHDNAINDLPDLEKAHQLISDVTNLIETRMGEYDRRRRCRSIERKFVNLRVGALVTPSRTFIAESKRRDVRLHQPDGYGMDIVLFLFNDCVLYGHYNEDSWGNQLQYDHTLHFDVLFKCEVEDNYKGKYCLLLYSRQRSIFISFKKRKLRTKWKRLIESANDAVNKLETSKWNKWKPEDPMEGPAPCYIPDDYSDQCQECSGKFTFTNRKHHCRRCGRLLCKSCTAWKMNRRHRTTKKNQIIRCCKKCKDRATFYSLNPSMSASGHKPRLSTNQNSHRLQRVHSEPSISRSPTLVSITSQKESEPVPNGNTTVSTAASSAPSISLLSLTSSCTEQIVMSGEDGRRHKRNKKKTSSSSSTSKSKSKSKKKRKKTKKKKTSVIADGAREERIYSDDMPNAPHKNPPTEAGYGHSSDEETGKLSLSEELMPLPMNGTQGGHTRGVTISTPLRNREIKVLQVQMQRHSLETPPTFRPRRGRSYAVASPKEPVAVQVNQVHDIVVGCVISTDDDGTEGTDDNAFLSAPSSADIVENIPSSMGSSKRSSPSLSTNSMLSGKKKRSASTMKKKKDKKMSHQTRTSTLSSWY